MLRRLVYGLWYYFHPPWDTGITPLEVVEAIEAPNGLPPGRALDLGCGTGTNSLYLARHGWQVVGVDFAGMAIRIARRKARQAGLTADFYVADVTRLDLLAIQPPFDLALDIGCFHSLTADARGRYLNGLRRLLRPGARWMLYAFGPRRRGAMNLGITTEAMKSLSQPDFRLLRVEVGSDPSGPAAAWYWLERI